MNFRKWRIAIVLTVLLANPASIPAAQRHWTNPAGGMFSNPNNWTPASDPTGDDLPELTGRKALFSC